MSRIRNKKYQFINIRRIKCGLDRVSFLDDIIRNAVLIDGKHAQLPHTAEFAKMSKLPVLTICDRNRNIFFA